MVDLALRAAAELERRRRSGGGLARYRHDPAGYAAQELGVQWWAKQKEIAQALITPPYRVLVKASHSVGKTHLAGGLVNWAFDAWGPSITLTTAPTDRQVKDLLWKEVRTQRGQRGGFPGPKMPRLEAAPDWFAHGFTARDSDGFQGHHGDHLFIFFDEAVGVDGQFWETAETMFAGHEGHGWLCIFNPTDTSSQAYLEEQSGGWHVFSISALEHPNVLAELAGQPVPFPGAVRLAWLDERIRRWCKPIRGPDRKASDIEWPPGSGEWWRPGPVAESRLLGRWPSSATDSVWSDAVFTSVETVVLPEPLDAPVEMGCDVARFGDDFTNIHVRRGPVSLHHEGFNGWSTTEVAGRLKELARQFGRQASMTPQTVPIKIDDDGVGGGVVDQAGGYLFAGVSSGSGAMEPEKYPNRRSELWFSVAERAEEGRLDLTRLPKAVRLELRRQAMAPTWRLDGDGRRVVESKAETKRRLKRSPDGMDALNLAYAPVRLRRRKRRSREY